MADFKSLIPWKSDKVHMPTRGDFLEPLASFRREMDRMFDSFFGSGPLAAGVTPAVDVEMNEKEVVITAELPGVDQKDIEVSVAGDVLTIKGQKKSEHEEKSDNGYYMERRFGSFARTLRLPFEVKDEQIDAKFNNGVLTVRLPKPAELQKATRKIEVKST